MCGARNLHTGLCRAADHPAIAAANTKARDVVRPTLPLSGTAKLSVDGVEPIDLCIVKSGKVRVPKGAPTTRPARIGQVSETPQAILKSTQQIGHTPYEM